MRLLAPPELDSYLQQWGYSTEGAWLAMADQGALSVGLEDPRAGTIPHLAPVGDAEPLVRFVLGLLPVLELGRLLGMPGRCGQDHHPEDADWQRSAGPSWARHRTLDALPEALREWGIDEQFVGAVLAEESDQRQVLVGLAEYAFVGRSDVRLLCEQSPLVCCLCHEGDLHFQSPDLVLLQRIRANALEAGFWPNPPDDWP